MTEIKIKSTKTEFRIFECRGSADLELMWATKNIVVDSDPRKKDHLILGDIKVFQPKNSIINFLYADLLTLCAPRYTSDILSGLKTKTGKIFKDESLSIIGINSF